MMGGIMPRHLKHRRGRIQRIDGVTVARQSRRDKPGPASDFENPGARMKTEVVEPTESSIVTVLVNGGQQPVIAVHRFPVGCRRFEQIADVLLASRCPLHTAPPLT